MIYMIFFTECMTHSCNFKFSWCSFIAANTNQSELEQREVNWASTDYAKPLTEPERFPC